MWSGSAIVEADAAAGLMTGGAGILSAGALAYRGAQPGA